MELVLPSAEYKDSFIEAVREFQAEPQSASTPLRYPELSVPDLERNFDEFVEKELSHAEGKNLKEKWYVPQSDFWLVNGVEFIGHVSVRHRLDDHLLKIGGHIGYDIRPSQRGKGYGNKILELVLPKARELGIHKALLTCDVTNIVSRKIIEKNGGLLENKIPNPETGVDKLRYWIDIK
jgi:predicted acetyltransferase